MITVNTVANLATARPGDGDLVQTRGYSVVGIGANEYRYSRTSSVAIDNVFVINGPGGRGRYIATNQGEVDITQAGALPNNPADSGPAIRRAWATGAKVTHSPGVFLVGPDPASAFDDGGNTRYAYSLSVPTGAKLTFDAGCTIKQMDGSESWNRVIVIDGVSDVDIVGEMKIDGNVTNIGAANNEHMHGLFIFNSSNIHIERVDSRNTRGDSVFIGGTDETTPSTNIVIGSIHAVSAGRKNLVLQHFDLVDITEAYLDNTLGGAVLYGGVADDTDKHCLDVEPDVFTGAEFHRVTIGTLYTSGTGNDLGAGITNAEANMCIVNIGTLHHNHTSSTVKAWIHYGCTVNLGQATFSDIAGVSGTFEIWHGGRFNADRVRITGSTPAVSDPMMLISQVGNNRPRVRINTLELQNTIGIGLEARDADVTIGKYIARTAGIAGWCRGISSNVGVFAEMDIDYLDLEDVGQPAGAGYAFYINKEGSNQPILRVQHTSFRDTRVPPLNYIFLVGDGAAAQLMLGTIENQSTVATANWLGADKYFRTSGGGAGPAQYVCTGTPLGMIPARIGSVAQRIDGGSGTTFYSKDAATDETGWVAVTGGGGSIPTDGDGNWLAPEGIKVENTESYFVMNALGDNVAGALTATVADNVTLAASVANTALQLSAAGAGGLIQLIIDGAVQGTVSTGGIDLAAGNAFSVDGVPVGGGLPPDADYGDITITGGVWTLDHRINVMNYGAVGDGVTDDTAAIQAAIAAMPASGSELYFPSGTYLVTEASGVGALTIASKSKFLVTGYQATIKAADVMPVAAGNTLLYFASCSDFAVEGLTVDGNRTPRTEAEVFAHSVALTNCHRFRLESIRSINAVCDGIYIAPSNNADLATYCSDGRIVGCVADNSYRNAMSIVGGFNLIVSGGQYVNSNGTAPEAGIDVEADVTDVGGAAVSRNITIAGIKAAGNNGTGIVVSGQKHACVTIEECDLSDCDGGAIDAGATAIIRGNDIHDFTAASLAGVVIVSATNYNENVSIEGNSFRAISAAKPCVYVHAVSQPGTRVLNNTAKSVTTFITASAPRTKVIGNVVETASTAAPFAIAAADCDVIGNTIEDYIDLGIDVTNTSGTVLIANNELISDDAALSFAAIRASFAAGGTVIVTNNIARQTSAGTSIAVLNAAAGGADLRVIDNTFIGFATVPFSGAMFLKHFGSGAPENAVTANVGSEWRASDGGSGTTVYNKETGTGDTGWVAVAPGTGGEGTFTTLTPDDTTPDVTGLHLVDTANTVPTAYAGGYVGAVEGQLLVIHVNDANTSFTNTASQALSGGANIPASSSPYIVALRYDGTQFKQEAYTSQEHQFATSTDGSNNLTLANSTTDADIIIETTGTGVVNIVADELQLNGTPVGGGGVSDGDKGDITVSASGATWTIDAGVVTYAKMQDVSATSRVLGRITAGAGDVEELTAANVRTIINVEDGADVTDSTNVEAAGAVMVADTSTSGYGFVIDEDTMTSNSDTKVPTQQSVKAYVDANSGGLPSGGSVGDLVVNTGSGTGAWSSVASVGANGVTITGGTPAASAPTLTRTQTWNAAGVTFVGDDFTITDTASAAGSLPIRIRGGAAGSTTLFSLSKTGVGTFGGQVVAPTAGYTFSGATSYGLSQGNSGVQLNVAGDMAMHLGVNQGITMYNSYYIGIGSTTNPSGTEADTRFYRDGAGQFAQRNGTNAQSFRVYGTYAGANSHERLNIYAQASDNFRIHTEDGATAGDPRGLALGTDETDRLIIGAAGHITIVDANDLVIGTTTGTKIGTATSQKIGFWNATPVVQQVLATGSSTDNVITLLQTLGLCRQS